jgi:hypothetical protein
MKVYKTESQEIHYLHKIAQHGGRSLLLRTSHVKSPWQSQVYLLE